MVLVREDESGFRAFCIHSHIGWIKVRFSTYSRSISEPNLDTVCRDMTPSDVTSYWRVNDAPCWALYISACGRHVLLHVRARGLCDRTGPGPSKRRRAFEIGVSPNLSGPRPSLSKLFVILSNDRGPTRARQIAVTCVDPHPGRTHANTRGGSRRGPTSGLDYTHCPLR